MKIDSHLDLYKIVKEDIEFPEGKCSKEALELLKKCLIKDPKERISIQGLIEDPYFNLKHESDVLSETTILTEKYEIIQIDEIDQNNMLSSKMTESTGWCIIA